MEYHHLSRIMAAYPNKAVSRFATYKIRKLLTEQGLANDEEVVGSLLLCRKCSQHLIPGINCEVSIEKSKKNYKNCAVYRCTFCQTRTKFNGVHRNLTKYDKISQKPLKTTQENPQIPTYKAPVFRSLNKTEAKKSLLESFFESAESNKIYNLFH